MVKGPLKFLLTSPPPLHFVSVAICGSTSMVCMIVVWCGVCVCIVVGCGVRVSYVCVSYTELHPIN